MRRSVLIPLLAASALAWSALVHAQPINVVETGTIASGAQYDLYSVNLPAGYIVQATLVCDEIAPGDRPLDPVLSVFFPGSDPDDITTADLFNDDGFGSDDDPNGVNCNAFQSSRVTFVVPATASYVFRADGFGSSTGPYTLTILGGPPTVLSTLGPGSLILLALFLLGIAVVVQRRRQRFGN